MTWICLISLIIAVTAAPPSDSKKYTKTSIDVARCKASCADKFFSPVDGTDSSCTIMTSPDCYMCWQFCSNLFDNYFIWVDTCNESRICSAGCRHACDSYHQLESPGFPLPNTIQIDVSVINDFVIFEWQAIDASLSASHHVVYVLRTFSQQRSEWIIFTQTLDNSFSIQKRYINEDSRYQLVTVTQFKILSLTDVIIDLTPKTTSQNSSEIWNTTHPYASAVTDEKQISSVMRTVYSLLVSVCIVCCIVAVVIMCNIRRLRQRKLQRLSSIRSHRNSSRIASTSRELNVDMRHLVTAYTLLDTDCGYSISTGFYKSTPVFIKTVTGNEAPKAIKQDLLLQLSKFVHLGKHTNFLSVVGITRQEEVSMLLMERMLEYTSLRSYLRECYNDGEVVGQELHAFIPCSGTKLKTCLNSEEILEMLFTIASTMESLAELDYIHKRLNANYLIIDPITKEWKLVDAELAADYQLVNDDDPAYFLAPEVLRDQSSTHRSDVWSFGCLLWQIVRFGEIPLEHIPVDELYSEICCSSRPAKPTNCSVPLYELMLSCWTIFPEQRPSFMDVVEATSLLLEHASTHVTVTCRATEEASCSVNLQAASVLDISQALHIPVNKQSTLLDYSFAIEPKPNTTMLRSMLPSTVRLDAVGDFFLSSRDSVFSSVDLSDDVFDQNDETSAFFPSPTDVSSSPTKRMKYSITGGRSNSNRKESIGLTKSRTRSVRKKVRQLFSTSA